MLLRDICHVLFRFIVAAFASIRDGCTTCTRVCMGVPFVCLFVLVVLVDRIPHLITCQ
jgi:hypothetical protein